MEKILDEIRAEREKQIAKFGGVERDARDARYVNAELARGAGAYIMAGVGQQQLSPLSPRALKALWPFPIETLKLEDARRNLIKGIAMAVAQVEAWDADQNATFDSAQ